MKGSSCHTHTTASWEMLFLFCCVLFLNLFFSYYLRFKIMKFSFSSVSKLISFSKVQPWQITLKSNLLPPPIH